MNLHDFIHFFAVLSVSCLIFGTREKILEVLFETGAGIFQNSENKFEKELEEILKKKEEEIDIRGKSKPVVKGLKDDVYSAAELQEKEKQKKSELEKDKSYLQEQYQKLLHDGWQKLKEESASVFDRIGRKFKILSLFIGFTTLTFLIIASCCHEFTCGHADCQSSNNHPEIYSLLLAFNLFIISYYIIIKKSAAADMDYVNPLNTVIYFIIEFASCIIPFIIFQLPGNKMNIIVAYNIVIMWQFIILFLCFAIPLFLLFFFYRWKRKIGIIISFSVLIQFFSLNLFSSNISDQLRTMLITAVVLSTVILILAPWIICFYYINKNTEKYETLRNKAAAEISKEITIITNTLMGRSK